MPRVMFVEIGRTIAHDPLARRDATKMTAYSAVAARRRAWIIRKK